jgi:hypothetical protein
MKRKKKKNIFIIEVPNEIILLPNRTFRPKEVTWEIPDPIFLLDEHGQTLDMVTKPSRFLTKLIEDEFSPEYELILRKKKLLHKKT